jgi:hypothetical protein
MILFALTRERNDHAGQVRAMRAQALSPGRDGR